MKKYIIKRTTDNSYLTFLNVGKDCTTAHFSLNKEAAARLDLCAAELQLNFFAKNRTDLKFVLSVDT